MASKRQKKKQNKSKFLNALKQMPRDVREAVNFSGKGTFEELQTQYLKAQNIVAQRQRMAYLTTDTEVNDFRFGRTNMEKNLLIRRYEDMVSRGIIRPTSFLDKYQAGIFAMDMLDEEEMAQLMQEAVERGAAREERLRKEHEERVRADFARYGFEV